jgi:hypothetical protein
MNSLEKMNDLKKYIKMSKFVPTSLFRRRSKFLCMYVFLIQFITTIMYNFFLNYRLIDLASISIEKEIAKSLSLDDFVERFASRHKNRRLIMY